MSFLESVEVGLTGLETPQVRRLLSVLFDELKDGVAVAGVDHKLLYLNSMGEKLAGKPSELSSEHWVEEFGLFEEDEATKLTHSNIPLVIALGGQIVENRHLFLCNEAVPEGIHLSVNASPLYDAGKKVIGGIAVFRDITDLIRTKQKLVSQKNELARSNGELERFAYLASHDLKEPLRMVSNYLRLIQSRAGENLDPSIKEFMGFALDGADRMNAMIDALLEYSKVANRPVELGWVPLTVVMEKALSNLEPVISEAKAEVVVDPLPEVLGHAHRYLQVFQNLISNAVKFRSERVPQIRFTANEKPLEWEFQISDNGIGIDPMFHGRVFEIFQRVHARGLYPGSGIGLSICQKVIESYGGRIWVSSALGKGSTFHFTLPKTIK